MNRNFQLKNVQIKEKLFSSYMLRLREKWESIKHILEIFFFRFSLPLNNLRVNFLKIDMYLTR